MNDSTASRRAVLGALGSTSLAAAAGCLDGGTTDEGTENRDDPDEGDGGNGGEHFVVETFDVVDRETGAVLVEVGDGRWRGEPLSIPLEETRSLEATVVDEDGETLTFGGEDGYALDAIVDEQADPIVDLESRGEYLDATGLETGASRIVFQLWRDGYPEFELPVLETEVVEDLDAE